jgi:hypothetical protein
VRRHFPVVLAGDGVGSPFGAFVKHAGSFDQFLSIGHGDTSTQVHMRPYMVKILFAQIGHEYLMLGRCWRIEGALATRRAG